MSVSQPCCSLQCCSSFLPESGQKMGGCGSKEQSDSSFEGGRTANGAVVPAAAKQATSLPSADAAAVSQVPDISVRRAVLEPCMTPLRARCTSPSQSSEAHPQPVRHRLVQQTRAVASHSAHAARVVTAAQGEMSEVRTEESSEFTRTEESSEFTRTEERSVERTARLKRLGYQV